MVTAAKRAGAVLALALVLPWSPVEEARAQGGAGRALTFDDFIGFDVPADPQISPDGRRVAYTVTETSLPQNQGTSRIWIASMTTGVARQLTSGPGSDRQPRWSPDGSHLAFVSTRSGTPQIWVLPLDGGEARKVTDLPSGASDPVWAPDGNTLFFMNDVEWPAESDLDRFEREFDTDAQIWDGLLYRHWDEWRAGKRRHVFAVPPAGGEETDLTPWDRDVPTITLDGYGDVAISPDGSEIAFVMNPDSVVATSTNNEIFLMPRDGGAPRKITTSAGNDNTPLYSPDWRYIAYRSQATAGFESDRARLLLYDRQRGTTLDLSGDWPLSVAEIAWAPDGRAIYATVEERARVGVYRIDVPSGRRTRVLWEGTASGLAVSPDGKALVFVRSSAHRPAELYAAGTNGRHLRPLTRLNDAALAGLDLRPAEDFWFAGAGGDSVHGLLVRPPGFDPTRKYPLVYLVHGGPQGAWLDQWHARWSYQMFAAPGYVVAAVNFHGSTGYGQEFTNSISQHWGDLPLEDLLKGVDAVLERAPYVDPDRLGAAGASYGGYMIFWLAGHTDRFRAFVAHDGVFNPVSMYGSTEELWFPEWEFDGIPYDARRAMYERWSPLNDVARWKTPILIIHGRDDFRVDLSEGLQAFTAAQRLGVPSRFLYFPDEGHWVLRPRNRRLWWTVVLDWLDRYLKPASEAASR